MIDNYRVFKTADEAEQWAAQAFPDLYRKAFHENKDFDELFFYGGNCFTSINRSLRWGYSIDEETDQRIIHLTDILSKHFVPDPIVVFRYTTKKAIRSLCGKRIIRKGMHFTEKAFVSTSLLDSAIKDYMFQNRCNCLLKIFIPEGTNGAYISYEKTDSLLRERELLLQRGLEYEIIRVHRFRFPFEIECLVKSNIPED